MGGCVPKIPKIIFICVKPNVFKKSLESGSQPLVNWHPMASSMVIFISVMAGIELESVRKALNPESDSIIYFARLMPNTAVTINVGICGTSIMSTGSPEGDQQFKHFLQQLLTPLGLCEIVDEHHLNAVCGLGGSGIAFVYTFIHAMSDGGVKQGLPRSVATSIAAQTVKVRVEIFLHYFYSYF